MIAALVATAWSILDVVVRAVTYVVRGVFDGLTVMLSNPVTFCTVGVIALACYGFGINRGMIIDRYRVEAAQQETKEWKDAHARLLKDAEDANASDKARFKAAQEAKAAAAAAERAKIDAVVAPAASEPQPKRVRPAARKAAPSKDGGEPLSLPGFPTLPWGPSKG